MRKWSAKEGRSRTLMPFQSLLTNLLVPDDGCQHTVGMSVSGGISFKNPAGLCPATCGNGKGSRLWT